MAGVFVPALRLRVAEKRTAVRRAPAELGRPSVPRNFWGQSTPSAAAGPTRWQQAGCPTSAQDPDAPLRYAQRVCWRDQRGTMSTDRCARLKRAGAPDSRVSPETCGTPTVESHQWQYRVPRLRPDDSVAKFAAHNQARRPGRWSGQALDPRVGQWAGDAVADVHLCLATKPERQRQRWLCKRGNDHAFQFQCF